MNFYFLKHATFSVLKPMTEPTRSLSPASTDPTPVTTTRTIPHSSSSLFTSTNCTYHLPFVPPSSSFHWQLPLSLIYLNAVLDAFKKVWNVSVLLTISTRSRLVLLAVSTRRHVHLQLSYLIHSKRSQLTARFTWSPVSICLSFPSSPETSLCLRSHLAPRNFAPSHSHRTNTVTHS